MQIITEVDPEKNDQVGQSNIRDRSLFMTGGASEENRIFQEIFLQPTQRAYEKFRGPLLKSTIDQFS